MCPIVADRGASGPNPNSGTVGPKIVTVGVPMAEAMCVGDESLLTSARARPISSADASSDKTLTLSGMQMILAGGLTADNILWDLHGGGGQVVINSGSNVYGTFLTPYRSFTGDHMNLLLGRAASRRRGSS